MQFIKGGPNVPSALLQAHEEGRVVFFCGAGISRAAGLGDFEWLVNELFKNTGALPKQPGEEQACVDSRYDSALELLERRVVGRRQKVREELAKCLVPDLTREGALETHRALLDLARDGKGRRRLVTTNFDRVFEEVCSQDGLCVESHAAPFLPIPKPSRWTNGIVYLHGLLAEMPTEDHMNRLVLTSGDFGLAYLNERWASRFVSELFRNFVVCFIGYSIDDTILRYMMDALAADNRLGETPVEAFAFGACAPGDEETEAGKWKSKFVTPILYTDPMDGASPHWGLHGTIRKWASDYRAGVTGSRIPGHPRTRRMCRP